ncbi:YppE family protein [Staphylococcus americanisciuri]|uniref:YppE family protein n=1 Tax=Staphylococcus americanisciuri TaxID=2973940 RepID=A0ABT2EYY0_9STAP|nr:YppE family protein [Staphylococcus americanisciuri]MCS4485440.1 YppE family protein [Staphylococcus americanisciuri]
MIKLSKSLFQALLMCTSEMESRYVAAREGHIYDFDTDIKPFVAQVDQHLAHLQRETSHVTVQHDRLITLLQNLSVTCHHSRTSKKQFYNQLKTVKHDMMTLK